MTGGAVVSVYAENPFQSDGLDFIAYADRRKLTPILATLGIQPQGKHYVHPGSDFLLDFPAPPLAVGDEPVLAKDLATAKRPTGVLKLLSPTQCVMDRLAAYYHWDDKQVLEQAVLVARAQPVNLTKVEAWSRVERKVASFRVFTRRLKG